MIVARPIERCRIPIARVLGGCAVLVGACACLAATPAAVHAENLIQVFEAALRSDPAYLAAGAENRAAQEVRPQARAELLPRARLSAGVAWNERRERDDFRSHDAILDIRHSIYDRSRTVTLQQADSRIAQADVLYAAARQNLMMRVSERYFQVLAAVDGIRFARATLEAFEQQLRQSQQRFEVGLIAITDVEEAKAGFDLAQAQLIAAENALDTAREALRETTGEYHEELSALGEMPLTSPDPADIDKWTEVALDSNLRLLAARQQAETARRQIELAQSGHSPTVDAVGSYGMYDDMSRGGVTRDASVGVRLNFSLYTGGSVVSRTRESRHRYQKALDELELQRRSAQRETRDAYLGVNSEISRVTALEQAVRSSRTAAEAIEAGFQVGTRTSVDVLDAKRDLFRARNDLARARYSYILNVLELKRAAGILSDDDLRLVSTWLE